MWPEEKKRGYIKEGYNKCELKELEHLKNIN
jgi:hypothetical protein